MLKRNAERIDVNVVWQPFAGSSQEFAVAVPVDVLLLEGTRGGGKTDVQLHRFRRLVGMGYGSYWRGVIFDREYKNLDDLVAKSERYFRLYKDGAKFNASDYTWTWPTGESLEFRHIKRAAD